MRRTAVCLFLLLLLLLASTASAQLKPGPVVSAGEPFPIVADINGDGLDDLIGERTVITSNGTGFDAPRDLGIRSGERVWAVLDVNGDGIPDLLTTSGATPPDTTPLAYGLYIGNPSRTYSNGVGVLTGGGRAYVADVNGDGKDDLVVMKPIWAADGITDLDCEVIVMLSRGDGTFETLPPVHIPANPQIDSNSRIETGDLDHDGIPDMVIRCPYDLVILHGRGGGRFDAETHFMPINSNYGGWTTLLADVDGDGNLDIIMPGVRRIRVYFGDGHGNFPRMATATIPKVHEAVFPANLGFLASFVATHPDADQPRDFALGHFTRGDRLQIAAGTTEGDIAVFSYRDGALKEDTRIATEFWAVDIRAGKFFRSGGDSIYAMGTLIWGEGFPPPHVFDGPDALVSEAAAVPPMRLRASRGGSPRETAFDVEVHSSDCISTTGQWVFDRDGYFSSAQDGSGTTVDALFDPPFWIYTRIKAPWSTHPVYVTLASGAGGFTGGGYAFSPQCGAQYVYVSMKPSAR